jgi:hypothetical protein
MSGSFDGKRQIKKNGKRSTRTMGEEMDMKMKVMGLGDEDDIAMGENGMA